MWRRDSAEKKINNLFREVSTPEGALKVEFISLCGAGVAHSLGKGEATGSNPVKGKFIENLIWVGARVAKGSRL